MVQLFRGDGLPARDGDAPEPLEQQVLTALDNVGDRDWTDLGNLQRSDSNGAIQDVSEGLHVTDGISGLFGNADESGFADFDPYAASVSPEPSVARTSDLPQHEHLPAMQKLCTLIQTLLWKWHHGQSLRLQLSMFGNRVSGVSSSRGSRFWMYTNLLETL